MPETTYLTLFWNSGFDQTNPTGLITLFLLCLCRIMPIMAFTPFFGAKLLPRPVKVGLGIAFLGVFFPMLLDVTDKSIRYSTFTVVLVVKEILIGFILGLLASVPSFIVQGAGMFVDHQRGGASLQVQDPVMQNQASPIGTLYDLVYIYLFWLIDGPFIFLEAIQQSFELIPPDQLFSALFFNQESPFWTEIIVMYNTIMKLIVQIASPSLIVILMTDTFLGIANRLAPNVMITFLGMPLKSFLGIFIIFLGWKLLTAQMLEEGYKWMIHVKELITVMAL